MKKKYCYDIQEVIAALQVLSEFNALDLKDLILCENDSPLLITEKCLEEFKFIGLSNKAFVETRFWESIDKD